MKTLENLVFELLVVAFAWINEFSLLKTLVVNYSYDDLKDVCDTHFGPCKSIYTHACVCEL